MTRGGTKNFVIRYKVAGQKRQAILTRAGGVSLRDARKRAADELMRVRAGESDPLERQRDARTAPTVAEGIDRFFDETVPERLRIGKMKPKTVQEYRLQSKTIRAALGGRRVEAVTRRDIERMVKPLKPVMRNRTLALVSRLFTLFQAWEWCDGNPARFVEKAREEPRDRTLADTEIAALASALDVESERSPAAVAAVRMAMLTGFRIGEVTGMKWADVDFENGRVTLPTSKAGRMVRPLSSAALEALAALPRVHGTEHVFSTGRAGVTYKTVHAAFQRAAKRAGLENVRMHDLRRTLMTAAAADGLSAHVVRNLLGHRSATMADRYVRHAGATVRDATERMGSRMQSIMSGKQPADVVKLRTRSNV